MKRKRSLKLILSLVFLVIVTLILLGVNSWPYIEYRIAVSKLNDKLSKFEPGKTILVFDPDFPGELKRDFTGGDSILKVQPFAYVHINEFDKPQIEFPDGSRKYFRHPARDEDSQEAKVLIQAISYLNLNWRDKDCTIILFSHDLTLWTTIKVSSVNYKRWPLVMVTTNPNKFPEEHPVDRLVKRNLLEIIYFENQWGMEE